MERDLGKKWASTDAQFEGRRVCLDLAKKECFGNKGSLSQFQKGCYRSGVCDALLTKTKAKACGYDTEGFASYAGKSTRFITERMGALAPRTR